MKLFLRQYSIRRDHRYRGTTLYDCEMSLDDARETVELHIRAILRSGTPEYNLFMAIANQARDGVTNPDLSWAGLMVIPESKETAE